VPGTDSTRPESQYRREWTHWPITLLMCSADCFSSLRGQHAPRWAWSSVVLSLTVSRLWAGRGRT
jgi:hypothetical protein